MADVAQAGRALASEPSGKWVAGAEQGRNVQRLLAPY